MTRRLVISLVGLIVVIFVALAGNLVADNSPLSVSTYRVESP